LGKILAVEELTQRFSLYYTKKESEEAERCRCPFKEL